MKWLDKLKEKGLDLIASIVIEPDEVKVGGVEEFAYCNKDDDIYITFYANYMDQRGMMVQLYRHIIPTTTILAIKKGTFVI